MKLFDRRTRLPFAQAEGLGDRHPGFCDDRACCCAASPAFAAVIARPGKPCRSTEILLCAHHFRDSRAALKERRAIVFDAHGRLVAR